jgi:hypothetical protein
MVLQNGTLQNKCYRTLCGSKRYKSYKTVQKLQSDMVTKRYVLQNGNCYYGLGAKVGAILKKSADWSDTDVILPGEWGKYRKSDCITSNPRSF